MAITYEYVGKTGGKAEVETYPFTVTASGSSNSTVLIRSLTIPDGERWMVVVNATVDQGSSTENGSPWLRIGNIYGRGKPGGSVGVGAVVTDNTQIVLHRGSASYSDTATGTVQIVKL